MPSVSNNTIRELYELYGNDDYPVEQYCIGCPNCEEYTFPCLNCAHYVFGGRLGQGNSGAVPMDIDSDIPDVVNNNDIPDTSPTIDDRIPSDIDSSDDDEEEEEDIIDTSR